MPPYRYKKLNQAWFKHVFLASDLKVLKYFVLICISNIFQLFVYLIDPHRKVSKFVIRILKTNKSDLFQVNLTTVFNFLCRHLRINSKTNVLKLIISPSVFKIAMTKQYIDSCKAKGKTEPFSVIAIVMNTLWGHT